MVNINETTGVAYGYVAANDLDGDVVHELMWGCQAKGEELDEEGVQEELRWGVYEGVTYQSSWLGGALNFWIFDSPFVVNGYKSSPCVPNACILNKAGQGSVLGHGIPSDWWSSHA